MMTKWDTIQADVADAYIGLEENEQYYQMLQDEDYASLTDEDELTLDWQE